MSQKLEAFRSTLSASAPFAETRFLQIADFLRESLDELVHAFGGIDPVVAEVLKLYDQFVAPVDVSWIPDVLEPAVIDAPAKKILEATIRRLHERIHKDS